MKKLYNILALLAVLALVFGAGCLTERRIILSSLPEPHTDTTFVRDTVWDYDPEKTVLPAGFELFPADTLDEYQAAIDGYVSTVSDLKDSLARKPKIVYYNGGSYISVPLFTYHFTDHKTYECVVTGFDARMNWHKSFQETKYITKTTEIPTLPKIAISPDFSALISKDVFFLGAGVKLDVWAGNWRFSPGVDYGLIWNGERWSHGPAGTFSVNYKFILK